MNVALDRSLLSCSRDSDDFLCQFLGSLHSRSWSEALGSLPDDTVVSSNSARCHRASTGEKSGQHLPSGRLPGASGHHIPAGSAMSNDAGFRHEPVMLAEIAEVFADLAPGVWCDATLGGAGHSLAILAAHDDVQLLGLDRDASALAAARERIIAAGLDGRATLRRARFDALASLVVEEGIESLVGVLFDLGVSSPQLDVAERGFSFRAEGPLDMRMDQDSELTAEVVVNTYSADELARLIADFSDERFARRIAHAIVAARPVRTTTQLAEIVVSAIPAAARRTGGHPAKRTFQAIRIEVNQELAILSSAITQAVALLAPGARLAVLTYHSGEDRIVKAVMRNAESGGCTCPQGLPCVCGARAQVRRVRAPRRASAGECARNPRARSARLRVVERLDTAAVGHEGEI